MNSILDERVAALEKQRAELQKLAAQGAEVKPADAWMKTIGLHKDDPLFEEATRLGAEWRREANREA